jgi:radical SAM superfamily enzyme YgiQ (UPF0313 family)
VPFPGALYGAFRIARRMKSLDPRVATVLGGGYVNTELRDLGEPRVFDTFDYVCYDDGEIPLLRIVEALANPKSTPALVRTRIRQQGRVVLCNDATAPPCAIANALPQISHRWPRRATSPWPKARIPCTACGPSARGSS